MHPPEPCTTRDQAWTVAEPECDEEPEEQLAMPGRSWGERWMARLMAVAALSTGLNALVQAVKVLIEFYFRRG